LRRRSTGDRPGDLFRNSFRQHPAHEVGAVAEGFDEPIRITLVDFCDRVLGDCVSAAVPDGIASFIRAKTCVLPRVADKPNLFTTNAGNRSE
jgi:hypothetical protein